MTKQALSPMDPESMGNRNVSVEELGDGYVLRTSTNKAGRLSYTLYVAGTMQMAGRLETIQQVVPLMRSGMTVNEANMTIMRQRAVALGV